MKFWDGEKYRVIACSVEAAQMVAAGLVPTTDKPKDGCELCEQEVLHVHVAPAALPESAESAVADTKTAEVSKPSAKSTPRGR
jgi:hypothetical protein